MNATLDAMRGIDLVFSMAKQAINLYLMTTLNAKSGLVGVQGTTFWARKWNFVIVYVGKKQGCTTVGTSRSLVWDKFSVNRGVATRAGEFFQFHDDPLRGSATRVYYTGNGMQKARLCQGDNSSGVNDICA
ncbi:MAG: hypothetical protein R3264_20905 [Anaerolineae bacterium]|nr:hypothetical protein [Anaerolineae bacterium]